MTEKEYQVKCLSCTETVVQIHFSPTVKIRQRITSSNLTLRDAPQSGLTGGLYGFLSHKTKLLIFMRHHIQTRAHLHMLQQFTVPAQWGNVPESFLQISFQKFFIKYKKSFWLVKVTLLIGFFLSDFKFLLSLLRSTCPPSSALLSPTNIGEEQTPTSMGILSTGHFSASIP